MKKKQLRINIYGIISRYSILILAALFNLWIFYTIFTPLTVYPVYFVIKLFFNTYLLGNILIINNLVPIELIKACIAGSAYYLLFVFNMSTPSIKLGKRISMIVFSFLSLLVLNILRIVSLIFVYMQKNSAFDITHEIFWYAFGTLFVVGIWFAEVKIYNIREIPIYSDIKLLIRKVRKT
jgi:exosortase/archaeosortase family protein